MHPYTKVKSRARGDEKKLTNCVLGIDRVTGLQSILGYHFGETRDFIKVYVAMPSLVPGLKRNFDEGISVPSIGLVKGQTYESNVPFVMRFMIDKDIQGADWVELPAGTYSLRDADQKKSRCTFETDIFL